MMLLPASRPAPARVSFDQLLQHNARRSPDAAALIDAPDRPLWTDGAPRRLTWAQVDAATAPSRPGSPSSASAPSGRGDPGTELGRYARRHPRLPSRQPRSRLLPAGWRHAEAAAAIERIGAKAIFAATRAGPAPSRPTRCAMSAADKFSVRFVCSFGADTPDGVVSFEDCFSDPKPVADTSDRRGSAIQPSMSRRDLRLRSGRLLPGCAQPQRIPRRRPRCPVGARARARTACSSRAFRQPASRASPPASCHG